MTVEVDRPALTHANNLYRAVNASLFAKKDPVDSFEEDWNNILLLAEAFRDFSFCLNVTPKIRKQMVEEIYGRQDPWPNLKAA